MSVTNVELQNYLDGMLRVSEISDYCPNGLQVEGASKIEKVVTGVTASQALLDAAIEAKADALIVHHGYFWKGEEDYRWKEVRKSITLFKSNFNWTLFNLLFICFYQMGLIFLFTLPILAAWQGDSELNNLVNDNKFKRLMLIFCY